MLLCKENKESGILQKKPAPPPRDFKEKIGISQLEKGGEAVWRGRITSSRELLAEIDVRSKKNKVWRRSNRIKPDRDCVRRKKTKREFGAPNEKRKGGRV